jgi:G3E family GTPase
LDTDAIPVIVLTGFLGSGKTTLLNRLLKHPEMTGTAVIINELGDVGLDQLLVDGAEEQEVLLEGGCICCTVRSELPGALRRLRERSISGDIPPIRRIVIETTGLATPTPILADLTQLQTSSRDFRLGAVITVVDAVNGDATLTAHKEAVQQVVVADRILISKVDLLDASASTAALEARLSALNPQAATVTLDEAGLRPELLEAEHRYTPGAPEFSALAWLAPETPSAVGMLKQETQPSVHDPEIRTFCVVLDEPVLPAVFFEWLEQVRGICGPDLLRMKGLVNLAGIEGPCVVHAVQTLLHKLVQLPEWPSDDHRSRIVFITRGWTQATLEGWLRPMLAFRPVRF